MPLTASRACYASGRRPGPPSTDPHALLLPLKHSVHPLSFPAPRGGRMLVMLTTQPLLSSAHWTLAEWLEQFAARDRFLRVPRNHFTAWKRRVSCSRHCLNL